MAVKFTTGLWADSMQTAEGTLLICGGPETGRIELRKEFVAGPGVIHLSREEALILAGLLNLYSETLGEKVP